MLENVLFTAAILHISCALVYSRYYLGSFGYVKERKKTPCPQEVSLLGGKVLCMGKVRKHWLVAEIDAGLSG